MGQEVLGAGAGGQEVLGGKSIGAGSAGGRGNGAGSAVLRGERRTGGEGSRDIPAWWTRQTLVSPRPLAPSAWVSPSATGAVRALRCMGTSCAAQHSMQMPGPALVLRAE